MCVEYTRNINILTRYGGKLKFFKKLNVLKKTKNRTIRKKTVRNMVILAHCKFVEKLKTKANEYTTNADTSKLHIFIM